MVERSKSVQRESRGQAKPYPPSSILCQPATIICQLSTVIRHLSTVIALCAILVGCTHETYLVDAKHPEVEYTEDGALKWHGRFIEPGELPRLLEKSGVDPKSQIDIRVPARMRSLKEPRALLFFLRRAGYTRGVLVTEKKAYSHASPSPQGGPSPRASEPPPQRRAIRYK